MLATVALVIRYLETFYRHPRLFTAPIFVAVIFSVGFALLQPATYQAQARIWYDLKGGLVDTTPSSGFDQYVTPADRQAQVLNELINTRAFATRVARRGALAGYVATPEGYSQAAGAVSGAKATVKGLLDGTRPQLSAQQVDDLSYALITRDTTAYSVGPQMVLVTVSLPNAPVAESTLGALVQQYSDEVLGDRRTQAQIAVDFWAQQADAAKARVQTTDDAVSQYLTSHPQLAQPNAVPDATLSVLRHTYDQNQQRYASLLDKMDQAKLDQAAATPEASGFRLIDRPRAVSPSAGIKRQLTLAGGGLVVGLLVSLSALVGMTLLDPTLRRREELRSLLGLRVVGTIPIIESARHGGSGSKRKSRRGANPGKTAAPAGARRTA